MSFNSCQVLSQPGLARLIREVEGSVSGQGVTAFGGSVVLAGLKLCEGAINHMLICHVCP